MTCKKTTTQAYELMQRDVLMQKIDYETQINDVLRNEVVRKMDSRMHIELECVFNVVMARNG